MSKFSTDLPCFSTLTWEPIHADLGTENCWVFEISTLTWEPIHADLGTA